MTPEWAFSALWSAPPYLQGKSPRLQGDPLCFQGSIHVSRVSNHDSRVSLHGSRVSLQSSRGSHHCSRWAFTAIWLASMAPGWAFVARLHGLRMSLRGSGDDPHGATLSLYGSGVSLCGSRVSFLSSEVTLWALIESHITKIVIIAWRLTELSQKFRFSRNDENRDNGIFHY